MRCPPVLLGESGEEGAAAKGLMRPSIRAFISFINLKARRRRALLKR